CCVVAPESSTAPLSMRVSAVTTSLTLPATCVVAWAQVSAPADRPGTGDPPRRPMPVLLRTSVLLI
ncbi:MAG: hypothetical protein O2917_08350, partial [Acidobacteria bacterium]|nr:hypothetical protein [Acidobacteriota bacterium]